MREQVSVNECTHPDGYKYRVRYPDGGKRKNKYFRVKTGLKGAEKWATDKRKELLAEGQKQGEITSAERRAIHLFREEVAKLPGDGAKATLSDAVRAYLESLGRRHKSVEVSLLSERLQDRAKKKGVGPAHLNDLRGRLGRFEKEYGDWLACDLTTEVFDDYLDALDFAPLTICHHRAALFQMMEYGLETGAAGENPVAKTIKPKVIGSEIGILTVPQVRKLLNKAPAEILPGLAIGCFAGIRRAELERMDWKEIDFKQGHIEIKASKSKTAARRLVQMQPNLKRWLQPFRQLEGPVMPSEMIWRTRLAKAMKAAKIKEWPHNALRHSFASYRLTATNNAALVALELGHERSSTLFAHYRALVTPTAAKAYWKIAPAKKKKPTNVTSIARKAS